MNKKKVTLVLAAFFVLLLVSASSTVFAQQSPIVGSNSDNKIQITIYSFTTATTITSYPNTPTQSGYVWGIADLSITNLQSSGTVSTNILFAHIKDAQGHDYTSVVTLDPQALKLSQLPAGQSQRGNVYWEIPPNTNIVSFYWYDYSSNVAIPALATPSPTPISTATPSSSPIATPTQTPSSTPTTSPTVTSNPTSQPTPSPTVPEFGLITIACVVIAITALLTITKCWHKKEANLL